MSHFCCPYCDRDQAIVPSKTSFNIVGFEIQKNQEGKIGAGIHTTSCSNEQCLRTTVEISIGAVQRNPNGGYALTAAPRLLRKRLLPQGAMRVFPDYIPAALLEDYREACLIQELSPKASATLVRRCLQGMIRDFCKISKPTLHAEIMALKALVDAGEAPAGVSIEAVDAIDHVRGIGNIGAHMERDIDLIVPVEPHESAVLISLVEMLFADWYVARHVRGDRLAAIKRLAAEKADARKGLPATEDFASKSQEGA